MHELLDFIGEIYEAAYRPEHWDVVAEGLCRLLNAKSAAIFFDDYESHLRDVAGSYGLPNTTIMAYKLGLSKYDFTFQLQRNEPIGIAKQLIDANEIKVSHPLYYRMLLKANNVRYIGAMNIYNDKEWHIGIGIHRDFNSQPFSTDELNTLSLLTPHFQRALRIHKEFITLRNRQQTLEATLNRFMLGVIILNPDDTIQFSNPVASALLTEHPAIRINHEGKLQPYLAQENIALYGAINRLRQNDKKSRKLSQMALSVHHPDKEHGLHILLSQLPQQNGDMQMVAYLADPTTSFHLPLATLQSLYGMTPAEANVAIALANGASPQQISERHQVSIETVRSQLKSIYGKMGVNKQQDVVRLLLSGVLRAN